MGPLVRRAESKLSSNPALDSPIRVVRDRMLRLAAARRARCLRRGRRRPTIAATTPSVKSPRFRVAPPVRGRARAGARWSAVARRRHDRWSSIDVYRACVAMTEDSRPGSSTTTREVEFIGRIDSSFPYADEHQRRLLFAEAASISANAEMMTLLEVLCSPASASVSAERALECIRRRSCGSPQHELDRRQLQHCAA